MNAKKEKVFRREAHDYAKQAFENLMGDLQQLPLRKRLKAAWRIVRCKPVYRPGGGENGKENH